MQALAQLLADRDRMLREAGLDPGQLSIGRGGSGSDPSIPECPICGAYGGGGHGGGCPNG